MSVLPAPPFKPAVPSGTGVDDRRTGVGTMSPVAVVRAERRILVTAGFAAVLLIATALRLYGLDREGLWGDEYAQVQLYGLPLHHTCWFAFTKHAFGPPDFVIGWLVHRLDPSVWMCRLPSAIWGVVGVAACFLLVRRLASWREGLVAAALLSMCRMHLVLSQEVRPYSICLAFLLITLVLLLWALEKPTSGRLVMYALVAYFMTLTRSFTPLVFLLVIGMVLTTAMLAGRHFSDRRSSFRVDEKAREHRAICRLWFATMLVGLAALPMVILLIPIANQSAFSTIFVPNAYEIDTRPYVKFVTYAGTACTTLWDNYGLWVLGLTVAGMLVCLRRWRTLPVSSRCALAVMAGVGPVYLLVYSLVGGVHYLHERYHFYLMPITAAFAAIAVVPMLRWLGRSLASRAVLKRLAVCLCLAITLTYPAVMSADEVRSYRRRDWRGCAAYLGAMVSPDDVIMVLTDEPFGRVQHRFFGKYEWPAECRPLAEAMWTLAVSDSHFERLVRQAGRCYTVIAYPVEPQAKDAYRSRGLQATPGGYRLVKFRGLDLLIREDEAGSLQKDLISICDDLVSVAHSAPSTNVIPLILKARTELHSGHRDEAGRSYAQAARLVPELQVDYFEHATAAWAPRSAVEIPPSG